MRTVTFATQRRLLWGLALLAGLTALGARSYWALGGEGPSFSPRPDALEYVASAQSISQSGRYALQIGPYTPRPRYSPGWPLLLAAALRLGIPPQALWLVSAACGAALAMLLAFLAAEIVQRRGAAGATRPLPVALAGAAAGLGWALAPVGFSTGGTALSDEPATLLCTLALVCGWAVLPRPAAENDLGERPAAAAAARELSIRQRRALAWVGGLALGALATIRPPVAALAGIPLAVLAARRGLVRERWRELLRGIGGALVMPVLVVALLVHSNLNPLRWSDYSGWDRTGARDMFSLAYAVTGDPEATAQRRAAPHLEFAALVLLGLPGETEIAYAGYLWPVLGWSALAIWGVATWRRRRGRRLALALAVWCTANVVFYGCYFFSAARFYLPLLALVAVCVAVGLAELVQRARHREWVAVAAALALAGAQTILLLGVEVKRPPIVDLRATVADWLGRNDRQHRARGISFDPVLAQAQGLLPPSAVAQIGDWGELPPTRQVVILRSIGRIPPLRHRPDGHPKVH